MMDTKIHIYYKFHKTPWGGSNQFLMALKKELKRKGYYEENIRKADCILFHPFTIKHFDEILRLKIKYPKKIFVHRIDGPLYLYRGTNTNIDNKIYEINHLISDGTIFQSDWSRKANYLSGLKNFFETIIMNASDNTLFFPDNKKRNKDFKKEKCKIICTSWSNNINKGFLLYQYLDQKIDFQKYSITFVGNTSISFKNIKHLKPVDSKSLARLLRENDIYLTGSKKDPCSNSLIEALSCGLPCVALNDGGHPEIIKKGGELFDSFEECVEKIKLVKDRYEEYRRNISAPDIDNIAKKYYEFISKIKYLYLSKNYLPKKIGYIDYFKFMFKNFLFNPLSTLLIFLNFFFKLFYKLYINILSKSKKEYGIEGKIISKNNNDIKFSRGNKVFKVKKNQDHIIFNNYDDWKFVQTKKGRNDDFQYLWKRTKAIQIKNWNFVGISKNDKMLEVGFRDGYNLKYLMEKGIDVEGIDVNPVAIEAARNLDCKVFEEDIQKRTHYEDKTFDIISACDILEHCFSPENALKEMWRILKDQGKIAVQIPFEKKFNRNLLHGHSTLFHNKKRFESLIETKGFYIVKSDTKNKKNSLFLLKKKQSLREKEYYCYIS